MDIPSWLRDVAVCGTLSPFDDPCALSNTSQQLGKENIEEAPTREKSAHGPQVNARKHRRETIGAGSRSSTPHRQHTSSPVHGRWSINQSSFHHTPHSTIAHSNHGEENTNSTAALLRTHEAQPIDPYARRPRRKTRRDRYEPARRGQRNDLKACTGCKTYRKRRRIDEGAPTAGLIQSFQLKSAPRSGRLSLRPFDAHAGLFKHGRASAQVYGKSGGLGDLAFNELRFLRKPREQCSSNVHSDPRASHPKDHAQELPRRDILASCLPTINFGGDQQHGEAAERKTSQDCNQLDHVQHHGRNRHGNFNVHRRKHLARQPTTTYNTRTSNRHRLGNTQQSNESRLAQSEFARSNFSQSTGQTQRIAPPAIAAGLLSGHPHKNGYASSRHHVHRQCSTTESSFSHGVALKRASAAIPRAQLPNPSFSTSERLLANEQWLSKCTKPDNTTVELPTTLSQGQRLDNMPSNGDPRVNSSYRTSDILKVGDASRFDDDEFAQASRSVVKQSNEDCPNLPQESNFVSSSSMKKRLERAGRAVAGVNNDEVSSNTAHRPILREALASEPYQRDDHIRFGNRTTTTLSGAIGPYRFAKHASPPPSQHCMQDRYLATPIIESKLTSMRSAELHKDDNAAAAESESIGALLFNDDCRRQRDTPSQENTAVETVLENGDFVAQSQQPSRHSARLVAEAGQHHTAPCQIVHRPDHLVRLGHSGFSHQAFEDDMTGFWTPNLLY